MSKSIRDIFVGGEGVNCSQGAKPQLDVPLNINIIDYK